MKQHERRFFSGNLRAESSGGKQYLTGTAANYGTVSKDLGGFREILQPGAFDDAMAAKDFDCIHNVNHSPDRILGRTSSGTTRITSDPRGLHFKTLLPNTTYAKDVAALCERGDLTQCSFSFSMDQDGDGEEWSVVDDPDQPDVRVALRTITSVAGLFDVSIVCEGAYPDTHAELSDRTAAVRIPPEIRALLGKRASEDDADEDPQQCTCDCENCLAGDCEDCDPETCQDPENCRCQVRSARGAGEDVPALAETLFAAIAKMTDAEKAAALEELATIAKKYGVKIGDDDAEDEAAADRARKINLELASF